MTKKLVKRSRVDYDKKETYQFVGDALLFFRMVRHGVEQGDTFQSAFSWAVMEMPEVVAPLLDDLNDMSVFIAMLAMAVRRSGLPVDRADVDATLRQMGRTDIE